MHTYQVSTPSNNIATGCKWKLSEIPSQLSEIVWVSAHTCSVNLRNVQFLRSFLPQNDLPVVGHVRCSNNYTPLGII